jgi:hypothetical protein
MDTTAEPVKACVALLILSVCCVLNAADTHTNFLSIYLVTDKVFPQWKPGTMPKPTEVRLMHPAVLADKDFVSFDVTNQTFVVTAEAAKRLARKIWELGKGGAPRGGNELYVHQSGDYEVVPFPTPFVLKAFDEPIYLGAFWNLFSSSSFAGPVIIPRTPFINTNSTSNLTFDIGAGYPVAFPQVKDPRKDTRIALAVRKLFAQ